MGGAWVRYNAGSFIQNYNILLEIQKEAHV